MPQLVATESGKLRKAEDVELAEKLTDLRKDKDHWAVIDELLKVWEKRMPEEMEAFKITIRDQQEVLIDPKFGQTKDGGHFDRRITLFFPKNLMILIRTQYKADELIMDSAFFKEFVKRYPAFCVPEKI